MADKKELTSLRRARGRLAASLTRYETFASGFTDSQLADLNVRHNDLLRLKADHDELVNKIDAIAENEEESVAEEVIDDFERRYYAMVEFSLKRLETLSPVQRSGDAAKPFPVSMDPNAYACMQLPKMELPEFKGEFNHWLQFKDSFVAAVHSKAFIGDAQKLQYLKLSLKGDASNIIESIQVSDANYQIAWDMICERFDNKRIIINKHISSFFDLPVVSGKEAHVCLRRLLDRFNATYRSLEALLPSINQWDLILIHIVVSKLDFNSRKEWEDSLIDSNLPTLEMFSKFLKHRVTTLDVLFTNNKPCQSSIGQGSASAGTSHKAKSFAVVNAAENAGRRCAVCEEGCHALYICPKFRELSIESRQAIIKKNNACFNCLRVGHGVKQCRASGCKVCKKKHNSLIHSTSNAESTSAKLNAESNEFKPQSNQVVANVLNLNTQVLLATICLKIRDKNGSVIQVRALFDSGSQSNFISEELMSKLDYPIRKINLKVSGICGISQDSTEAVVIPVKSTANDNERDIPCFILNKLTGKLPTTVVKAKHWKIPEYVELADPSFFESRQIDMIIGAVIFWESLLDGRCKLEEEGLILQNTFFGWIVSGQIKSAKGKLSKTSCSLSITKALERFWQIEEVNSETTLTSEEEACTLHFNQTISRNSDGVFVARLPFNAKINQLGESYKAASKRLCSLERKLSNDVNLARQYKTFIDEYIDLGHMSLVPTPNKDELSYFIPHHAVVKESSLSTKLRVVFDASAKTSTGISLNDALLKGPCIQDLVSLLLRFRKFPIVFTADICKMYRQILIDKEDTKFQLMLWRNQDSEKIETYRLNTVTYGTKPASFIATKCLQKLAEDESNNHLEVAKIIKQCFYMDDLLSGAESVCEAQRIQRELYLVLLSAGFELKKWRSNVPQVLDGLQGSNDPMLVIENDTTSKALGIKWDSSSDSFCYDYKLKAETCSTKRSILSAIASIYDPLGLLAPLVIVSKMILQKLWQSNIGWDDAIPQVLQQSWSQFYSNLGMVHKIEVPRYLFHNGVDDIQLIGFSDASERAYGACLYARSVLSNGTVVCRLIAAKSRVAPLKIITLPRLELCGALLLAELQEKIIKALAITFQRCYYFTDSTIVLSWIRRKPATLKTFVANRIATIQGLTNALDWYHVSSKENPADLISRGVGPQRLIEDKFWWQGPAFLQSVDLNSILKVPVLTEPLLPELRVMHTQARIICDLGITKFSSLRKLVNVFSYCQRFIKVKLKKGSSSGPLTAEERAETQEALIRNVQGSYFANEIKALEQGKAIHKKSNILSLTPFLDKWGLLRVGGRLENSPISFEVKHPILLPSKCHLTLLIVRDEHERLLHIGPQGLLASLRDRFWLIGGRNMTRRVVRDCVRCFRVNPQVQNQLMGQLPAARTTPSRPFLNVGIDYAGPFLLRDRKGRNFKKIKAYLGLFVCLVTKAVHIEAVSELTTEAFMACLKRFFARRGKSLHLYTDNATNFKGGSNELRELYDFLSVQEKTIVENCAKEAVSWHFIPPKSPHFGGIWEAGIKSCKNHLKRVMGNACLTFEEFNTVIVQIEACLNSRPLSPLSNDPNDFCALTPGHFLIGTALMSIPDPNLTSVPCNRLSRFQMLQQLYQHFWQRWQREYLSELQMKSKWRHASKNLKVGDIVVLKEDNLPPLCWALGRILEVQRGKDGIVRVVTVRTATGNYKRAISRVCSLPFNDVQ